MTSDQQVDRARLRELAAAARGNDMAALRAMTALGGEYDTALALLDALDAAERERDEWKRAANANHEIAAKYHTERDALAADARRWQAIDAHWRTAQCYFRKDATNSIRAVQMFIDFDHRNDGKALGGVVDEAIAALAAREPT